MRVHRLALLSLTLIAVGTSAGCGSKKSSSSSNGASGTDPAPTTPEVPVVADTNLTIAGVLSLVGSQSPSLASGLSLYGFPLDSSAYDIYCVTFEDTPKAGHATVASDGAFNGVLEDFAGKPFGCFLRQNGRTLTDIVFEADDAAESASGDTQLVAGAGALKVNLLFDPDTKVASALIKKAESSALASDKLAQAKAAASASDTVVANMTGTYALACQGVEGDDGSVAACPPAQGGKEGIPQSLYLHEFVQDGVRRVGIWPDTNAPSACFGSAAPASELNPSFGAKIGSHARVSFDLSSLSGFQAGVDNLIADFAADYPTAMGKLVDATAGGWGPEHCQQMEQMASSAAEKYTDSTCRLIATDVVQKSYIDPKTGEKVERWEPQWYSLWSEVEAKTDVTDANVSTFTQQCFNPKKSAPLPDMPPCPPDLSENPDTGATASFTVFDYSSGGMRKPLQFVCRNPMEADKLQFFPVVAKGDAVSYKAAAVANLQTMMGSSSAMGQQDPMCAKVDVYGRTGVYKAQVQEIRRAFLDLIRDSRNQGEWDQCTAWTIPADPAQFNFAACNTKDGGPVEGQAVCWNKEWVLQDLGLSLNLGGDGKATGFSAVQAMNPFLPEEMRAAFCPSTTITYPAPNVQPPKCEGNVDCPFDQYMAERKAACKQEFLTTGSLSDKLGKLFNFSLNGRSVPPSVVLQCGGGATEVKTAMAQMTASACVPEANIDTRCDRGQCVEVLRCWGTPDGNCLSASGEFLGRVPGRFELATLKPRVNEAFELSALSVESWSEWSEGSERTCKAAHGFVMQSKQLGAGVFDARMVFKESRVCEGDQNQGETRSEPALRLRFTKQ